jgi:hypothetical protein
MNNEYVQYGCGYSAPNSWVNFDASPTLRFERIPIKETSLGKEKRSHGLKGFISEWFGNSQHLWMWDYFSISQELKNTGFVNIRRAEFGDSTDPMFNEVEEKDRWLNCLSIECIKADD